MRFDPAQHNHGSRPTPPDHRPYRPPSADGDAVVHNAFDARVEYRQIGWHGQSGAIYSLDEDPSAHEPGSYSPIYVCVDHAPRTTTAYRVGYCDGYVDGGNGDPQRYLHEPDGDEHPHASPTVDGVRGHLIRDRPGA